MLIYTYQPVGMKVSLDQQPEGEVDDAQGENRNQFTEDDEIKDNSEEGDSQNRGLMQRKYQVFLKATVLFAMVVILSIYGFARINSNSTETSTSHGESKSIEKQTQAPNPNLFLRQEPARSKQESVIQAGKESIDKCLTT